MHSRRSSKSTAHRKDEVKGMLKEVGRRTCESLDSGMFPEISFPVRTVRNIVYDSNLRQYVLGPAEVTRSAQNIKHIRPFTQLLWLAFFAKQLIKESKTSTLRDVYYSSQAYDVDFVTQDESDEIITDLEVLLSRAREELNIYPEERSAIFGDVTVEYTIPGYEGRRLNLTSHPDGILIGPSLSTADFVESSAEMVIAVEKGGLFTRFIEEKVHERYKAIVIDTAGQPPRSTRYMLKRLHDELSIPVYILTDGDVYGEHIAMVIVSGSANAAHLRELTVPSGKWIGVWGTDIPKYKLPSDSLSDLDMKRIRELKQDPRYRGGIWQRELDAFLKHRRKSELEAFSKYGLTTITDMYLPEKLEIAKSL